MRVLSQNINRNNLITGLFGEGKTVDQIAAKLGVTRNVVAGVLRRSGSFGALVRGPGVVETPSGLRRGKLSADMYDQIRAEYVPRVVSMPILAERYGVSIRRIEEIINGDRRRALS